MFPRRASQKKDISFVLLCIIFTFPLLPSAIQSISIALFLIVTILEYGKSFRQNWKNFTWKPFLVNTGWFIVLCLTLLYSSQKGKGADQIIRGLSLIIFPFLFIYFIPRLDKNKLRILTGFYISAHLFLFFYMYAQIVEGIDTIGYINETGERIKGISKESWATQFKLITSMPFSLSRYYLNENEISSFFVHKAYLSMGYLWSIFIMVYILIKEKLNLVSIIVLVSISLLFTLVIIYFTSIPNLFSLVVLLPLFVFIILPSLRKRIFYIVMLLIGLVVLSKTHFLQDKLFDNKRLSNGITETSVLWLSIINNKEIYGSNIRIETWKCAREVIPERFFSGYGMGSEPIVLKDCYDRNKCFTCSEYKFNAHNNYLTLLISGGVIALAFFLFSMCYSIWLSLGTKNYLYLFFLLIFMLNLMSESMLNRIHGILFFALFNSVFFANSLKEIHHNKM